MGIEGDLAALSFSVSRTRSLCRFDRALSGPGGCSSAGKQSAHADPVVDSRAVELGCATSCFFWKHGHPSYGSAPRATTRSIRFPFGQLGNLTFDQDVSGRSGVSTEWRAQASQWSRLRGVGSRIEATVRKVLQRLSQFSFLAQPSAHNSIHTLE